MRTLSRLFDVAISKLGPLGAVAIIFVAVLSVVEIFRRYVLNSPSIWATDLVIAIAAVVYVLAGPYAHLYGRHIEITVFSDLYRGVFRRLADLIKSFVGFVYVGALLYGAVQMASTALAGGERTGTAWDVPLPQIIKLILVFALTLFLILIIRGFMRSLVSLITGRDIEMNLPSPDKQEIL